MSKAIPILKIGGKKLEYYKEILIKADNKLHEQIYEIVMRKFGNRKDISILDVACGDGALSLRLYDTGFSNIDGIDKELKPSLKGSINIINLDLNDYIKMKSFAEYSKRYDLILSIETIEHLENPWEFMRFLNKILKPEGTIILSMPNVNSLRSKISFLIKDRFFQFDEAALKYFHINPISTFEFETISNSLGLVIVERIAGGTYPIIWLTKNLFSTIVYSLGNILLAPFVKGMKYGWCTIYVLKKNV